MDILIAKIGSEYKRVLSQEGEILKSLDISEIESIDYQASYKLDDGEWFKIGKFSDESFFIDQCKPSYSPASLSQIEDSDHDYQKTSVVIAIQGNQIHLQRITPSLFIDKKTFLNLSGAPEIVKHNKQILLKTESDAIYLIDSDTLYFKNLGKLKVIFPDIEELYREATHEEVEKFLLHNFISTEMKANDIAVQNRKRIADIGEKYQALADDKKVALVEYVKSQVEEVKIKDGLLVINSENDLKELLYAMDQRYYYADVYREKRLANSIRTVNKPTEIRLEQDIDK